MFSTLLESRIPAPRSAKSVMPSVIAHGVIVGWAIVATAHPRLVSRPVRDEPLVYVERREHPPRPTGDPAARAGRPSPTAFTLPNVTRAVIDVIQQTIPGLPMPSTDPDPSNVAAQGDPTGVFGTPGSGSGAVQSGVYNWLTVDKPAVLAPGAVQPPYPSVLREASVEGRVMAQFIVDTTGRAIDSTIVILESSHSLFASSVRAAIPRMRFIPAEAAGRRVRQLVQQPFEFSVVR